MQRSVAVLCESNHDRHADTVTHTILTMLGSPVHIQLTAVGWQPFKGKDLTFPFIHMKIEQRQALKTILDEGAEKWHVYEHAMMYKQKHKTIQLQPLNVLTALCMSVLSNSTYSDKRLRLTVCNILLQRIQVNIPIERSVQQELNTRLFSPTPCPSPTQDGQTPVPEEVHT